MFTAVFLAAFFGLLAAGMPIFLVLGISAAGLFAATGQPLVSIAQKIVDELNSSTLTALPLFVMAAAFMRRGGVAKALVDVATGWFGQMRGALGWSRSCPAPCSPRPAARRSRPRWPWARSWCRR